MIQRAVQSPARWARVYHQRQLADKAGLILKRGRVPLAPEVLTMAEIEGSIPFKVGDRVRIRYYDGGPGRIVEIRGPLAPGGR